MKRNTHHTHHTHHIHNRRKTKYSSIKQNKINKINKLNKINKIRKQNKSRIKNTIQYYSQNYNNSDICEDYLIVDNIGNVIKHVLILSLYEIIHKTKTIYFKIKECIKHGIIKMYKNV